MSYRAKLKGPLRLDYNQMIALIVMSFAERLYTHLLLLIVEQLHRNKDGTIWIRSG